MEKSCSVRRAGVLLLLQLICCYGASGQQTTVNIDAPNVNQTYSGTQVFGGWAVDNQNVIRSVAVQIDRVPLALASYGGSRQDVCDTYANYPNCPNVGWSYAVDTRTLSSGVSHEFSIRVITSDGRETFAEHPFYVSNSSAATITFDNPGYGSIVSGYQIFGGLAVDNSAPITDVECFLDGAPIGKVVIGGQRDDVCGPSGPFPAYPGCPNVGFSYGVDTSKIENGTHTFSVATKTSDGRITTFSDYYFSISNHSSSTVVPTHLRFSKASTERSFMAAGL